MRRALFEKTGNAAYISHLDLMRLFQRAFKRAGLSLTHTKGFNPRPSVSIALPLSLGVESRCELLDFDLEGDHYSNEEIRDRLNEALVEGVRVLDVYGDMNKLRNLTYLSCEVTLEYDDGIPENAETDICELFARSEIVVEKKGKNGLTEQDIAPMIQEITTVRISDRELRLDALICCQNPSLNPAQLSSAVARYHPELTPDFVRICRTEIYDTNKEIFR